MAVGWLVTWLAGWAGFGADIPIDQSFVAQTWHGDHGLPQNSVQAFCQTRDGFLWIGTRFGLARFDGLSFRSYATGEVPEIRDGSVSALAEDADGTLWIGEFDGLVRLRKGRFERVSALDGERLWALWSETPARLWAGLNRGLVCLDGRGDAPRVNPTPFPSDGASEFRGPAHVRSLAPDGQGGVVITTPAGWQRMDLATGRFEAWRPKAWVRRGTPGDVAPGSRDPWEWHAREAVDGDVADFDHRLFHRSTPTLNEWGPRTHADGRGGWWFIARQRWVAHLDEHGLKQLVPAVPRTGDGILAVFGDREGLTWLGGTVSGVTRLRPRIFQAFPLSDEPEGAAFTVALDREDRPWTASRNHLLSVGPTGARLWPLSATPSNRQIFSLAAAADGGWWLGWDRRGVFHWNPARAGSEPRLVFGDGERPRALLLARDGTLWAGLATGLIRHGPGGDRRYGAADGLPHPDVRAIHEDREGRLWVATFGGGVAWLDADRFRVPVNHGGPESGPTWGFLEDRRGATWIYGSRGLARWLAGRFSAVTRAQGLFDDLNNQMLEDADGDFWLGCNRGIYRVTASEIHGVADGTQARLTSVVYGAADGLPIAETNGEYQPAGARTSDGVLWFPTPLGLLRVDPKRMPGDSPPPAARFTRIRTESVVLFDETGPASGGPVGEGGVARIPPGRAHVLEATFTAPHFAAPERLRFRHRLLGYDTQWVENGTRRETRYTNLRPGRYRLEVTACSRHGVWSEPPAAFDFEIAPRLVQHPLFGPVLVVAAVAVGLVAHRVRVRLVTRRQHLVAELRLARERERISRDMHDDVGATLTQIGLLAARTRQLTSDAPAPVPALLERLAGANREAAQAMDEIVWALNPSHDRLDNLANYLCQFAREYLEATGIRSLFEVPPLLPPRPVPGETRHHVLMILKEALGNAARHSGARVVRVGLALVGDDLLLSVADDGRGFAVPPDPDAANGETGSDRNGLRHMRRRVAALDGRLVLDSAPGQGTRIEVFLPLSGD